MCQKRCIRNTPYIASMCNNFIIEMGNKIACNLQIIVNRDTFMNHNLHLEIHFIVIH